MFVFCQVQYKSLEFENNPFEWLSWCKQSGKVTESETDFVRKSMVRNLLTKNFQTFFFQKNSEKYVLYPSVSVEFLQRFIFGKFWQKWRWQPENVFFAKDIDIFIGFSSCLFISWRSCDYSYIFFFRILSVNRAVFHCDSSRSKRNKTTCGPWCKGYCQ